MRNIWLYISGVAMLVPMTACSPQMMADQEKVTAENRDGKSEAVMKKMK
jgi:hypothetical protein